MLNLVQRLLYDEIQSEAIQSACFLPTKNLQYCYENDIEFYHESKQRNHELIYSILYFTFQKTKNLIKY